MILIQGPAENISSLKIAELMVDDLTLQ